MSRNAISALAASIIFLILLIVAIVFPRIRHSKTAAREAAAMDALRVLRTAQETFRSSCVKDIDGDGFGEYGTIDEMAGLVPPAGKLDPVHPPFIDDSRGNAMFSAYNFSLVLGVTPLGEEGDEDPKEHFYFATAWPIRYGLWGRRTFWMDQSGVIHGSDIGGGNVTVEQVATSSWPEIGE